MNDALAARDRASKMNQEERLDLTESFRLRLARLIRTPKNTAVNERLARHLENHLPEWFMFLADPKIPAANTLGEQAMRPPIVNRKVWGGNRTWLGAQCQQIVCSVLETCRKLHIKAIDFVTQILCGLSPTLLTNLAAR